MLKRASFLAQLNIATGVDPNGYVYPSEAETYDACHDRVVGALDPMANLCG